MQVARRMNQNATKEPVMDNAHAKEDIEWHDVDLSTLEEARIRSSERTLIAEHSYYVRDHAPIIVSLVDQGLEPPYIGDGLVVRVFISLPCDRLGRLIEEIKFEDRIRILGESLTDFWGNSDPSAMFRWLDLDIVSHHQKWSEAAQFALDASGIPELMRKLLARAEKIHNAS